MKNIHVLPTDKPSRLIIYSKLFNEFRFLNKEIEDWNHKRHIYITSDEEIKEGDWCYVFRGGTHRVEKAIHNDLQTWKKIILTTDQDLIEEGVQAIDDEFLEWFVKNPSCEEVEVISERRNWKEINWITVYKIIIPKEEPKQELERGVTITHVGKQETLEEAADKKILLNERKGFIACAKWQQERSYSEEEVMDIAKDAYAMGRKGILIGVFNKWFEQFKNK